MKLGKPLKILKNKTSRIVKLYFIIGSIFILMGFLLFTHFLSKDIQEDVSIVPDLYAQFIGLPDNVNLENFLTDYFMTEIIPSIDYPIIFCDSTLVPFSWENINVESINYSSLDTFQKARLKDLVKKYQKRGSFIELYQDRRKQNLIGYVFFGETRSMKQLRYMPFIASIAVIIFIALGAFALGYMRRNEKNQLWIGLAKETAHQFGTPTSSLLAWLSIIRSRLEAKPEDKEAQEMLGYINHMETDVSRLQNVASRFGKVGSTIKLTNTLLDDIVNDTVEYFKSRVPSGKNKVELYYFSEIHNISMKIDKDLIKWTLENLIKNAVDAMIGKSGKIIITAVKRDESIQIRVSDEGKGISRAMYQRIFLAGVTSKERGWGLGLSLAKRIIEEYHNGKIKIIHSEINKGTTFEIMLPLNQ